MSQSIAPDPVPEMTGAEIKAAVIFQWRADIAAGRSPRPFLILGEPGGGKTETSKSILNEAKNEFNLAAIYHTKPSHKDVQDYAGLPNFHPNAVCTQWLPPEFIYQLREGSGAIGLCLDELGDAMTAVMNVICSLVQDKLVVDFKLTDQLFIIATGNEVKHKSGANRLLTKLTNRLTIFRWVADLKGSWTPWAQEAGIDPGDISFLHWKPELFQQFDPNATLSPTARSWTEGAFCVPKELLYQRPDLFLKMAAGSVGLGPAAEYTAFRQIMHTLPDPLEVLKAPATYQLPDRLDMRYALLGALCNVLTPRYFAAYCTILGRYTADFSVLGVQLALSKHKKFVSSDEYTEWASTTGVNVLL